MRSHAKASSAGSSERRLKGLGTIVPLLVLFALAIFAPSASAKYIEVGSFADNGSGAGGSGSEDGQLSNPGQADVNSSTGDLYIADTGNNRVQRFTETSTGASYASQVAITAPEGLAIDQSDGSVYVSNASGISKLNANLTPAAGWTEPAVTGALAVDPTNGDLLVADTANNLIRRFESDGTAAGSFAAERPIDLDVTSTGALLIITSTGDLVHNCGPTSTVEKFSAAGSDEGSFNSSLQFPGSIAIDPDDGTVLVSTFVNEYWCAANDLNPRIEVLDSQGTLISSLRSSQSLSYAMVPGLAVVGNGSERAYFLTKGPENDGFGPTKAIALENFPPPAVSIDPVDPGSVTATEATVKGTVNPQGLATEWHFEYRVAGTSTWSATATSSAGSGESPVDVEATLTELPQPNKEYEARLIASSAAGESTSPGPNPTFTTDLAAPLAETQGATVPVKATEATLYGSVNPNNSQTHYWFEWGSEDCASSPCASVPLSQDADAGSSFGTVFVSKTITGLAPQTTYHYRLLAENQAGKTTAASRSFTTPVAPSACPNAGLRVGASASLPDCRAYEMASPLEKNGGEVSGHPARTRVATDGNAVSYASRAGFAGTAGYPANGAEYISRRNSEGWSTYPITPQVDAPVAPSLYADSQYVGAFSPDLSRGVFRALNTVPDNTPPNVRRSANLYLGENLGSPASSLQILSDSVSPLPPETTEFNIGYVPPIQFADASDDFSHILFESRRNLTADASGAGNKTYEWVEGQGLRLAGILPDDACASPPCPAAVSFAGKGVLASNPGGDYTQQTNTISADGSRVFFTARAEQTAYATFVSGDLYLRENGTTTAQIDASELSTPIPGNPGSSEFEAATPDGSVAFFISTRKLTDDDVDPKEGRDLYRYDVEAPAGHRLTLMTPESTMPQALFVKYVPGISADGEYVYIEGVEPGPDFEGNGPLSLALLHDGEVRFVARKGNVQWGEEDTFYGVNWIRISPDGHHVLLASDRDNGHDLGGHPGLFLYSADSDQLACVSCKPSGEASTADASFTAFIRAKGDSDGQYLSQPLSADGRHAFFDTSEALVPEDTNGKLDAYEYDSESGRLALISSGECNCDSVWVGASPSGDDAFFITTEQLVRADTDNLYDIYDARVGGGIAAQNRLPAVGCEGDACQPVTNPPASQTPSSAGFNGPANPAKARKPRHKHKHKSKRKRHRHASKAAQHKRHARNHGKQG